MLDQFELLLSACPRPEPRIFYSYSEDCVSVAPFLLILDDPLKPSRQPDPARVLTWYTKLLERRFVERPLTKKERWRLEAT